MNITPKVEKKIINPFMTINFSKRNREIDVDKKIDTYEKKLERIFTGNFDVYNGYYTIKTDFQKIPRPQKKQIKKVDIIQGRIDIDNTMNMLKRAINNDEGMRMAFNRKNNIVKLNKNQEEQLQKIPSTTNLNEEVSSLSTTKFNFTEKNYYTNLSRNRSNLFRSLSNYPLKETEYITSSPNEKIKTAKKTPEKLNEHTQDNFKPSDKFHFKAQSCLTTSTHPVTNYITNFNLATSSANTYSPEKKFSLDFHKNFISNLLTSFKKEERTASQVSKKIKKIKVPSMSPKKFDLYSEVDDVTQDKNLIMKKREVLIYNSVGRDLVLTNKVGRTGNDLNYLKKDFMDREQKKKLYSILFSSDVTKGIIERKIKVFKDKINNQ